MEKINNIKDTMTIMDNIKFIVRCVKERVNLAYEKRPIVTPIIAILNTLQSLVFFICLISEKIHDKIMDNAKNKNIFIKICVFPVLIFSLIAYIILSNLGEVINWVEIKIIGLKKHN